MTFPAEATRGETGLSACPSGKILGHRSIGCREAFLVVLHRLRRESSRVPCIETAIEGGKLGDEGRYGGRCGTEDERLTQNDLAHMCSATQNDDVGRMFRAHVSLCYPACKYESQCKGVRPTTARQATTILFDSTFPTSPLSPSSGTFVKQSQQYGYRNS
jgi:hypothetical protein